MQVMVAGLLYQGRQVLLVEKRKPKWQDRLWNAVGGKVELGETPIDAMRREFSEETGVFITDWTLFCSEFGPDYVVHFFRHVLPDDDRSKWPRVNDAGEPLAWAWMGDIPRMHCVGNVTWLVPLGCDPRPITKPLWFDTKADIKEKPTW